MVVALGGRDSHAVAARSCGSVRGVNTHVNCAIVGVDETATLGGALIDVLHVPVGGVRGLHQR